MNKKTIILIVVTILIILVSIFFVGGSFGLFKYLKKGDVVNVITINGIKVEIVSCDNDCLNLKDAYPISDEEGLTSTPFVFKILNNTSNNINYSIKIIPDSEKINECYLDDGTNCPELTTNYIKYAYKKNDGTYSEPKLLSDDNNTLTTDIILANSNVTSSVIIWIDENSSNEIMNHYFFGKLIIEGSKV